MAGAATKFGSAAAAALWQKVRERVARNKPDAAAILDYFADDPDKMTTALRRLLQDVNATEIPGGVELANEILRVTQVHQTAQGHTVAQAGRDIGTLIQAGTVNVHVGASPWSLSPDQIARLIDSLRSVPREWVGHVDVVALLGNGESLALATQLDGALKAGGWTSGVSQAVFAGPTPGLGIVVRKPQDPPGRAVCLQQALASVGLTAPAYADPNKADDAVALVVGSKEQERRAVPR